MRISSTIVCLLAILCSTKGNFKSTTSPITIGDKGGVLYENGIVHAFSSPVRKDSFNIRLTGESILRGMINFVIRDGDGLAILDETYHSTMLLDYGLPQNSTDKQKEEYIKSRIDKFFTLETFHQPAIDQNAKFDVDFTSREVFDDIRADQTSIGFYYLIGEEDGRQIAYSKKLKKTVVYFSCC